MIRFYTPGQIARRLSQEPNVPRFLAARALWRTGLSSLFSIRNGRFSLTFFPTALSAALWYNPDHRAEDEAFFYDYLRDGDTVIDVGANIGHLTLAAAWRVGSKGRVLSIEAHPKTFEYLRRNIARNRFTWIDARNVALGDRDGSLVFTNKRLDDQNEVVIDNAARGISVRVARLDDVAAALTRIELLKIDVEGYEKFVLLGAQRLLALTQTVYFEVWGNHARKYGYEVMDLIRILRDSDFSVFRVVDHRLYSLPEGYRAETLENLIAVRSVERFTERCPAYSVGSVAERTS